MTTEGGTKKTKTPTTELEPGTPEFKASLAEATERMGQINGRLRKTAADQIEIGIMLRALHQTLPHKWKARIYSDSDNPLPEIEPLDITQADGEQLIRIAKNSALADSRNSEKLPWARSTLDVLSKLPAETLQAAIDRGEVTRKLKCAEAEKLVKKLTGQQEAQTTENDPAWNAEVEKTRLADRILAAVESWTVACPSEELSVPQAVLRKIADYLQKGQERHALLTQAGLDFLSNAKQRVEDLARENATAQLSSFIRDVFGLAGPRPEQVVRVIEHVVGGRICGQAGRAVLEKALEAQESVEPDAAKKSRPAPRKKPKAGR